MFDGDEFNIGRIISSWPEISGYGIPHPGTADIQGGT
jgi:hypothetical protein